MLRIPGWLRLALLTFAGMVLAGCSVALPQSPLDPQGPVAVWQKDLLMLTLYIAAGIGAVVTCALLYVVYRFRAQPGQTAIPRQVHGNHTLEVIWTVIPILILAVVAVPTVQAARRIAAPPDDALVIRASGHQWWFAFEYQAEGFTTANELRIPVGKPVKLLLQSGDVIHSFWVPKLAGKVDMIPNRTNTIWFQADAADTYYGQCAEFCGDSHAMMRFRVVAMEPADYETWVRERKALTSGPRPLDPVAARGKELFESKANCFACHAVDGTKAKGIVGPNLTDLAQRKSLAAGIMANTRENLTAWVREPGTFKPGTAMPDHKRLAPDELEAIIAYLESLK